jgi:hypothetical protein
MILIEKASYLPPYAVHLCFQGGEAYTVDLGEVIRNDHRPVIRELGNTDLFARLTVDADTLCWPNGVDFAPEFLYALATSQHASAS